MTLYECDVCGYIFDMRKEDVAWDDLPEDWVCPICTSGKMYFVTSEVEDEEGSGNVIESAARKSVTDNEVQAGSVGKIEQKSLGYAPEFLRRDDKVEKYMDLIHEMAVTGKTVIEAMGSKQVTIGWEDVFFVGAQLSPFVLEEDAPVNTTTIIGKKAKVPLVLDHPVYITHMSFGALSRELKLSLARGAAEVKTAMCSGEGGILTESMEASYKYIFEYVPNLYSATDENFKLVDAVEIKIGQGTKPGMGGHLPGDKVTEEIASVRNKPLNKDIISPSKFKDINSIEDMKVLVDSLREKTGGKPIGIKLAAGRIEEDLQAAYDAGADFITFDGRRGSTGASPKVIKDSTTIPTLFAVYRARKYINEKNLDIDLVVTGGFRISSDVAKAIALGADAVAIGTGAMMAVACQQYRVCNTGNCPVGCATQDAELRARLNMDKGAIRLSNYLKVMLEELKVFSRITGNSDVHDLSVADLCTTNSEISNHTDIRHV